VEDDDDEEEVTRVAGEVNGIFPVILEDIGEITAQDGEIYAEILQEFSRTRFPANHHRPPRPKKTENVDVPHPSLEDEIPASSTPFVVTDEMKARLTEIFNAATEQQLTEMKAGKLKYSEEDIPQLRDRWMELSIDIMSEVPETMHPLHAVNHRIPLIDEKKAYTYHLPRCPDAMKEQLIDKINRYVRAGWWKAVQTDQAAPMLCIPKKTGLFANRN
jgi:hypothetical protein